MGYLERARARRIQVGVHHAAGTTELELKAVSLANLQGRRPETANKLLWCEADETAGFFRLCLRNRGRCGELLGRGSATSEHEGEEEDGKTAHKVRMALYRRARNVAAS